MKKIEEIKCMTAVERDGSDAHSMAETANMNEKMQEIVSNITNKEQEEKKIVRALDFRMMPLFCLFYFTDYLDRANIGNATLAGIQGDLNLTSAELSTAISAFYITYIVFEIPSNVILKKTRASIWLSSINLLWGVVTLAIAFVTNFGGLFACRIMLGMAQSGYIPGILYQMSLVYKPNEISFRVALLIAMSFLSGIVSGPIAYGCSFLEGHLGKHGWQYLFIIEGIFTISLSIVSYFTLFDDIQKVSWLTPEQKAIQYTRMSHSDQPHVPITFKLFIKVIKDYKIYLFGFVYLMTSTNHTSFTIFAPSIINGFGYPILTSQLLSAPPHIVSAFFTIVGGYLSNRYRNCRSILAMVGFGCLAIGYTLLLVLEDIWSLYGALFVISTGIGLFVAPVVCWSAVNFPDLSTRALAIGTVVMIGNTGGVVASFLYPTNSDPKHFFGNMFNICVGLSGFILASTLGFCLRRINQKWDQIDQEKSMYQHHHPLDTISSSSDQPTKGFRYHY
ncbi:unnamed protein product [Cunninghamella blakesleeana]